MIIPREHNMVRLYIQIASSTDKDWNPRKQATQEEVQTSAKKILAPYYIEWDRVEWYSVYPIGQGIAEKYTLDHRIFIGGDACHTHSVSIQALSSKIGYVSDKSSNKMQPKAGQGMNTAFLDAVNLAWKIHHVESGFASRSTLQTYESERKLIAETLLNFDAKYAALFSQRKPSAGEVGLASQSTSPSQSSTASELNEFVETFKASCEFTSGYGILYPPNIYNHSPHHPARSPLFLSPQEKTTTLHPGRILPPSNVTRVADANIIHLEQAIPLNGAFRLLIFAGHPQRSTRALIDFCAHLTKKTSFLTAFLRPDLAQVSHHETHTPHSRFFTLATIFAAARVDLAAVPKLLPPVLARYQTHVYADDLADQRVGGAKMGSAHRKMGLDEERGGVVVVRPDGHVGCVVRLVEGGGTVEALNRYFGAFVDKAVGGGEGGEARL